MSQNQVALPEGANESIPSSTSVLPSILQKVESIGRTVQNSLSLFSSNLVIRNENGTHQNGKSVKTNNKYDVNSDEDGSDKSTGNNNFISHSITYTSVGMSIIAQGVPVTDFTNAMLDLPTNTVTQMLPHVISLTKSFDNSSLGIFFFAVQEILGNPSAFKTQVMGNLFGLINDDSKSEKKNDQQPLDEVSSIDRKKIEDIIDDTLSKDDAAIGNLRKYVTDASEKVATELQGIEKTIDEKGNEIEALLNEINEIFEGKVAEVVSKVKSVDETFNQNVEKVDEHLKMVNEVIEKKLSEADDKVKLFEDALDQKLKEMEAEEALKKPGASKVTEEPKPVEEIKPNEEPKPTEELKTVEKPGLTEEPKPTDEVAPVEEPKMTKAKTRGKGRQFSKAAKTEKLISQKPMIKIGNNDSIIFE